MNAVPQTDFLDHLQFDNRFTAALPADPRQDNQRRQVSGACYSRVQPTAVREPRLLALAPEVARLIGLPVGEDGALPPGADVALARVFGGNQQLPGMDPHACCYGGHQFGNWAGQLGDGRAINLGEVRGSDGQHWMLQLKGAGPTPYSRTADGLAVLRSSLREFLCSEAMHHLGVPTTRALSLVGTGESVVRDMFYDGNPQAEPGAVVCRVAPSFTRFGSFEIFAARGEHEVLRRLLDHTIRCHFGHLGEPGRDVYLAWFDAVCRSTATLMAHWMRVGFVHGVMNTDNMSVLGLTIDYGPYGWLEDYDPDWTPNTTDAQGRRYRYGQQPAVALWNLVRLANAIYPLVEAEQPLRDALAGYEQQFEQDWRAMQAAKLGLETLEGQSDAALVADLHTLLRAEETDMTLFYRHLAEVPVEQAGALDDDALCAPLAVSWYRQDAVAGRHVADTAAWLRRYAQRCAGQALGAAARHRRMCAVNPLYVPRNYLAQEAIDAAEAGDTGVLARLMQALRQPYQEQDGMTDLAARRPEWARHRPGCSMLSCSS